MLNCLPKSESVSHALILPLGWAFYWPKFEDISDFQAKTIQTPCTGVILLSFVWYRQNSGRIASKRTPEHMVLPRKLVRHWRFSNWHQFFYQFASVYLRWADCFEELNQMLRKSGKIEFTYLKLFLKIFCGNCLNLLRNMLRTWTLSCLPMNSGVVALWRLSYQLIFLLGCKLFFCCKHQALSLYHFLSRLGKFRQRIDYLCWDLRCPLFLSSVNQLFILWTKFQACFWATRSFMCLVSRFDGTSDQHQSVASGIIFANQPNWRLLLRPKT